MPCRVSNADPSCAAAAAAAASHLQAPSCSSSNSSSPASLHALYPTVQMVQSAHGGITTSMSNQTAAAAAAAAAGGNGGIGIANGYVQLQQQQHQPPTSPLPTGEHREHYIFIAQATGLTKYSCSSLWQCPSAACQEEQVQEGHSGRDPEQPPGIRGAAGSGRRGLLPPGSAADPVLGGPGRVQRGRRTPGAAAPAPARRRRPRPARQLRSR